MSADTVYEYDDATHILKYQPITVAPGAVAVVEFGPETELEGFLEFCPPKKVRKLGDSAFQADRLVTSAEGSGAFEIAAIEVGGRPQPLITKPVLVPGGPQEKGLQGPVPADHYNEKAIGAGEVYDLCMPGSSITLHVRNVTETEAVFRAGFIGRRARKIHASLILAFPRTTIEPGAEASLVIRPSVPFKAQRLIVPIIYEKRLRVESLRVAQASLVDHYVPEWAPGAVVNGALMACPPCQPNDSIVLRVRNVSDEPVRVGQTLTADYKLEGDLPITLLGQDLSECLEFAPVEVPPASTLDTVTMEATVLARDDGKGFRGTRLLIPAEIAGHLEVADIFVAGQRQFGAPGPVPARCFSPAAVSVGTLFDTAKVGETVAVVLRNTSGTPLTVRGCKFFGAYK